MTDLREALDELPVFEHGPDFWGDLEAALDETAPTATGPSGVVVIGEDDAVLTPLDDPVELAAHRRLSRRRLMVAIAAAAAAVIALVLSIGSLTEDSGPPPFNTDITVPPDEPDAVAVVGNEVPELSWTAQPSTGIPDAGLITGSAHDRFYALVFGSFPAEGNGLVASDDGVTWAPVVPESTDDDFLPWVAGQGAADFEPAAFEVVDDVITYAELTTPDISPARLRVWQSRDGSDWTFVEVDPLPPTAVRDHIAVAGSRNGFIPVTPVAVTASPIQTLVSLDLQYEVDWWQFDNGSFDPDGVRPFGVIRTRPTDRGMVMVEPFPLDAELGSAPPPRVIPWSDLASEAKATFDWVSANPPGQQLLGIGADGATRLPRPPIDGPWRMRWTGTEFEAWSTISDLSALGFDVDDPATNSISYSPDGRQWSEPIGLPVGIEIVGSIAGNLIATSDQEILVSRDRGRTFESVDFGGSTFDDPDGLWGWGFGAGSFSSDLLEARTGGIQITNGVAAGLVTRGDIADFWVIRSTDGIEWTTSFVDRGGEIETDPLEPNRRNPPRSAVVGPDGEVIVFSADDAVVGLPVSTDGDD